MKEGWKMVKLKDICNKASSNVAQKDLGNNNGNYPIFGASGFIKNVDFFHYDKPYIGIVKDGSGVGRVTLYPAYSSLLGTLQYILPKEGFSLSFVYYALQSLDLSKYKIGAAIPHIYFRDYGEKELSVPHLEEQHRIVSILDAAFEKIDKLKANAEENLKNAKALFQQVLAQELKPKEGWVEKKMENICTLCQGLAINSQTKHLIVENSNLALLRIKDLKDGTREIFIDEISCPENCKVYPDDIIYTRTGTLGLVFTGVCGVMHNNCFKIIINKNIINKGYVMHYLQSEKFKENIISKAKRAAQPDITHKIFKAEYICYPSLDEQERIVQTLDALSEKCRRLETIAQQTIRECDALKQSILRQAFSGEL